MVTAGLTMMCAIARLHGEEALPIPIDVPAGPTAVEAPGGKALPVLSGEAKADAPALSMISDVTFPDETLVIAGDKLDGARLRVWAEGVVRDIEPLRAAQNRMQAVLPKDMPLSTMLVWPVKNGGIGAPIRVNGATAWWGWPARLTQEQAEGPQTVLVMGKNLKLGEIEPRVYLVGPNTSQWLKVTAAHAYQIQAELPRGLAAGTYRVWAHNGTGGRHGWSDAVAFEVVAAPSQKDLKTFRVDDFGAKPDDSQDDAGAIQAAVDAAAKAGGGIVAFSAGVYHVSRPIVAPAEVGAGIHFAGAGMGQYDPVSQQVRGPASVIRLLPGAAPPNCLLDVNCRRSTVRDLTLIGGHPGMIRAIHQRNPDRVVLVRVTRQDVSVERVRFVMLDLRPDVPPAERKDLQIYDAALYLIVAGEGNLLVRDCEFHSAGSGIEIGSIQRGHTDDGFPDPSTDYVRIENCVFRGYSRGFYKEPEAPASYSHMGIFNSGILVSNAKCAIIHGCDFAGADRRGGKMINRSICVYNTSTRNVYIADNKSHDVGMTCPRADRVANQGEQIIFHFRYPHGGYFDVLDAAPQEVSVNPQDPRNAGKIASPHRGWDRAGSRVLEEVGTHGHWIVFVSAGTGVGQYRVVVGTERSPGRIVLKLDRPWRVTPDRSSRVTLTATYRQNIIFRNEIDAGFIDPRSKVAGVLFWFNAMENVIAGCTLRNVGYGFGFNAGFRNPCCWNLVRDNVVEHVGGMSVESIEPVFYIDSCSVSGGANGPLFQAGSDVAGWYAAGNVARSNRGSDGPTAALVHGAIADAGAPALPKQDEAGVIMPVVENSTFTAVKRGIVINNATVWPVLRNNVIETVDSAGPKVFDQSLPARP